MWQIKVPISSVRNRQLYITLAIEIIKRFSFAENDVQLLHVLAFLDQNYLPQTRYIAKVADFFGFDLE